MPQEIIVAEPPIDFKINKGFTNFGNTCFYNATLQSIFKCPELMTSLRNYDGTNKLLKFLKITIQDYYLKPTVETIGPILLLRSYREMNTNYMGGTQEDARECLTYFLDNFDMATKSEGINISSFFDCKLASILKCPLCKYESLSAATEKLILLPIKSCNNFEDAMHHFLEEETLDSNNKWTCDKCKVSVAAEKKLIIKGAPKYLFIALKRFEHEWIKERNTIKTTKINHDVLMSENITINTVNYSMKGCIYHSGNLQGGHYVYFHKYDDSWTLFNDDDINENIKKDSITNQGYIYLYEKN